MRTMFIALFCACSIFLGGCCLEHAPLDKNQITVLTPYGIGNLKGLLEHQELQVSFLDKDGKCGNTPFIHPGWMTDDNHKHYMTCPLDMIRILETYEPNSIDVIYFGTHGSPGGVRLGKNHHHISDLFTDGEVKLIKSRLKVGGYFAFTGCGVARNPQACINFANRIQRKVIAASVSTDNDTDVSLWSEGVWILFYPR